MRCRPACLLALVAALALPASAAAAGGRVAFDGGTPQERAQVRAALDASSFDYGIIPVRVVVHLIRGAAPQAVPGQIWLDPALVDTGQFAWGVILHEFAHQVDWYLLTDADRAAIQALLGGSVRCGGGESFGHDGQGCERFATAVAWAYWPSPANVFDPAANPDETWLKASALRDLLAGMLGVRNPFRALTVE